MISFSKDVLVGLLRFTPFPPLGREGVFKFHLPIVVPGLSDTCLSSLNRTRFGTRKCRIHHPPFFLYFKYVVRYTARSANFSTFPGIVLGRAGWIRGVVNLQRRMPT